MFRNELVNGFACGAGRSHVFYRVFVSSSHQPRLTATSPVMPSQDVCLHKLQRMS